MNKYCLYNGTILYEWYKKQKFWGRTPRPNFNHKVLYLKHWCNKNPFKLAAAPFINTQISKKKTEHTTHRRVCPVPYLIILTPPKKTKTNKPTLHVAMKFLRSTLLDMKRSLTIYSAFLDIKKSISWYQEINSWYQEIFLIEEIYFNWYQEFDFLISRNWILDIKNSISCYQEFDFYIKK